MAIQSGNTRSWSQLLKSAVLCMNSSHKKSHGSTAFRVMWGRDSRYEDLIPAVSKTPVSSQDDIDSDEVMLSDEDIVQDKDMPEKEQLQECMHDLDEFRTATSKLAGENIRTEQLKQKRQYDKKVSQKR